MAKKVINYINNKTLYEAMIEYHTRLDKAVAEGKAKPQVTNYIGESILLICQNLSRKGNFGAYSPQWKQEMISDATIDCVAAVDNFNVVKYSNPHAYFSQIAWSAFLRRIEKEKKQTYIKHKNYENSVLMNDYFDGAGESQLGGNEYSDELVRNYENKLTEKKKSAKLKSKLKPKEKAENTIFEE